MGTSVCSLLAPRHTPAPSDLDVPCSLGFPAPSDTLRAWWWQTQFCHGGFGPGRGPSAGSGVSRPQLTSSSDCVFLALCLRECWEETAMFPGTLSS